MPKITEFNAPSKSTRSQLLIQQKLNQRSKEAMIQREITPEILPTKAEVKLLGLDDDNPQAIADKHRKSTSIQIQLTNMANNAIVDELGWKPSKIKSETTQRMIDEYKAEMNQPVKVIDPITGKEVVYKYKPSSVDLSPIIPEYTKPLTENEIWALERKITENLGYIKDINKSLKVDVPKEQKRIDDEYNATAQQRSYQLVSKKDITDLTLRLRKAKSHDDYNAIGDEVGIYFDEYDIPPSIFEKQYKIEERIKQFKEGNSTIQYDNDKLELRRKVEMANENIKQLNLENDTMKQQILNNPNIIKQNAINQAEADKQTKSKMTQAIEELRVLNSGKAIPEQQPGESDDSYRQRLIDIGNEVLDDADVEREAGMLQFVKGKYNLKELLSDDAKIETVLKEMSTDEITVMNTIFPAIKKKYLETVGYNNKNISTDQLVAFINETVSTITNENTPAEPAQVALPDDLIDYLRQQQITGGAQVNLMNELSDYIEDLKITGPAQAILPPELTNYFQQHQVSAQAQETQLTELLDYLRQQQTKGPSESTPTSGKTPGEQIKEIGRTNGITNAKGKRLETIINELNDKNIQIPSEILMALEPRYKQDLLKAANLPTYVVDLLEQGNPPLRRSPRLNPDPSTTGSGLGVHLKKLPKVIKVGHIHINPSNLYYEHILSVRNPKNKPLRAYKDEHLSAYLASLLIKLIEGGTIKKYELQPLSDHEKMIYDNLIKRSKLHTMNDNTFETTAGKMKDRLMVLEGELEAGNTNPLIKNEIHGLLFKLAHAKVISNVDATRHWKSLNEIY
jgi:hypothetical protein